MRFKAQADKSKTAIVDFWTVRGCSWTHLDGVGKGVPDGILGFLGIDQQVELKSGAKARTKPETLARQLAYYVTIYSPIQMAADLPENYEANPGPFQFIKDVAVDWDDTRMLSGSVGDYAVVARKERGKPTWFLGGITDEEARSMTVPLSFLEPGRRYRAEIYRDGDDADFRTNPRSIAIERRTVRSTDNLPVRLAAGGGVAVRFVPLGR